MQTLTPLPGLWVYCGGPESQGLRPGLNSCGPPGLNTLGPRYGDFGRHGLVQMRRLTGGFHQAIPVIYSQVAPLRAVCVPDR